MSICCEKTYFEFSFLVEPVNVPCHDICIGRSGNKRFTTFSTHFCLRSRETLTGSLKQIHPAYVMVSKASLPAITNNITDSISRTEKRTWAKKLVSSLSFRYLPFSL